MVQIDFNAEQYEPDVGFEPIPAGQYLAHITNSDKRETRAKDGSWYLWFEFEVREGAFAGRKLWANLNLSNTNPKAVTMANAQFSALCRAAGKMRVADTQELHMIPLEVKVVVREGKGDYGPSNEIRGFRAVGVQPGAAQPAAPTGTTQQGGKPAWGR